MSSSRLTQKTPCVNVCQMDSRTRWCIGCGRTVDEITKWPKMTPYRQKAVVAELKRRLSHIEDQKKR